MHLGNQSGAGQNSTHRSLARMDGGKALEAMTHQGGGGGGERGEKRTHGQVYNYLSGIYRSFPPHPTRKNLKEDLKKGREKKKKRKE